MAVIKTDILIIATEQVLWVAIKEDKLEWWSTSMGVGGGAGVQYHRHQHSIHCMSVEIGLNTDFTRLCYLEIGLVFCSHKHESSDE